MLVMYWIWGLSGTTFSNSGFGVHNNDTLTCNLCYKVCLNRSHGWGWAFFEINEVRNIPFLPNSAQPQPLLRFFSFLCQNAGFKFGTSNPDFEIMPLNGTWNPQLKNRPRLQKLTSQLLKKQRFLKNGIDFYSFLRRVPCYRLKHRGKSKFTLPSYFLCG